MTAPAPPPPAAPWSRSDSIGLTAWQRLMNPGVLSGGGLQPFAADGATGIHDRHSAFLGSLSVPLGGEADGVDRGEDVRVFRAAGQGAAWRFQGDGLRGGLAESAPRAEAVVPAANEAPAGVAPVVASRWVASVSTAQTGTSAPPAAGLELHRHSGRELPLDRAPDEAHPGSVPSPEAPQAPGDAGQAAHPAVLSTGARPGAGHASLKAAEGHRVHASPAAPAAPAAQTSPTSQTSQAVQEAPPIPSARSSGVVHVAASGATAPKRQSAAPDIPSLLRVAAQPGTSPRAVQARDGTPAMHRASSATAAATATSTATAAAQLPAVLPQADPAPASAGAAPVLARQEAPGSALSKRPLAVLARRANSPAGIATVPLAASDAEGMPAGSSPSSQSAAAAHQPMADAPSPPAEAMMRVTAEGPPAIPVEMPLREPSAPAIHRDPGAQNGLPIKPAPLSRAPASDAIEGPQRAAAASMTAVTPPMADTASLPPQMMATALGKADIVPDATASHGTTALPLAGPLLSRAVASAGPPPDARPAEFPLAAVNASGSARTPTAQRAMAGSADAPPMLAQPAELPVARAMAEALAPSAPAATRPIADSAPLALPLATGVQGIPMATSSSALARSPSSDQGPSTHMLRSADGAPWICPPSMPHRETPRRADPAAQTQPHATAELAAPPPVPLQEAPVLALAADPSPEGPTLIHRVAAPQWVGQSPADIGNEPRRPVAFTFSPTAGPRSSGAARSVNPVGSAGASRAVASTTATTTTSTTATASPTGHAASGTAPSPSVCMPLARLPSPFSTSAAESATLSRAPAFEDASAMQPDTAAVSALEMPQPAGSTVIHPDPARPAAAAPALDFDALVERTWRAVMTRLSIERERRGYGRWS